MTVTTAPTLMAVHAHPDDEASSTGGILSKYSASGIRTVLVTCTNGELGDGEQGVKPGEPGHDPAAVVATRRRELEASCELLGVGELELLGYRDSGMMGWPQNTAPGAFWNVPVDEAAARLGSLIERYRPDVVVTYDERGFYGHPDHIQANRITVAALAATGVPARLYYPAIPSSELARFAEAIERSGIDLPEEVGEDDFDFAVPDETLAARVDCTSFADRKFAALAAHASQDDNAFFLRFGPELFAELFGVEFFVDATGSKPPPPGQSGPTAPPGQSGQSAPPGQSASPGQSRQSSQSSQPAGQVRAELFDEVAR